MKKDCSLKRWEKTVQLSMTKEYSLKKGLKNVRRRVSFDNSFFILQGMFAEEWATNFRRRAMKDYSSFIFRRIVGEEWAMSVLWRMTKDSSTFIFHRLFCEERAMTCPWRVSFEKSMLFLQRMFYENELWLFLEEGLKNVQCSFFREYSSITSNEYSVKKTWRIFNFRWVMTCLQRARKELSSSV